MLSLDELRSHVVAVQGFATRHRKATLAEVEAAIARLSCVQLDTISTVDRSHRLVLGSRVGALPEGFETKQLASGRVFEYWAHEASIVPMEDWPLFRPRMEERRVHHWFGDVIGGDPKLARAILARIRKEGALPSRAFEGKGAGGMWGWKPAKRMLDALWTAGELAIVARKGFERHYDLPERVVPERFLKGEPPSEAEATARLIEKAVAARGALTLKGICDHYRLGAARDVRPHVDRLVEEGRLERHEVDDEGPAVFVPAGARMQVAKRSVNVLLSPFENMLWDREFVQRAWGFDHTLEIYVPAPKRKFGYYVMPWLLGDRLSGRADVKADRASGKLLVRKFHLEKGIERTEALEEGGMRALALLARRLGVDPPEQVRLRPGGQTARPTRAHRRR